MQGWNISLFLMANLIWFWTASYQCPTTWTRSSTLTYVHPCCKDEDADLRPPCGKEHYVVWINQRAHPEVLLPVFQIQWVRTWERTKWYMEILTTSHWISFISTHFGSRPFWKLEFSNIKKNPILIFVKHNSSSASDLKVVAGCSATEDEILYLHFNRKRSTLPFLRDYLQPGPISGRNISSMLRTASSWFQHTRSVSTPWSGNLAYSLSW